MDLDHARFTEAVRLRLKNLLDSMPEDPLERDEWQERVLMEAGEPLDDLRDQVSHLQSKNDVLQQENKLLRTRLANQRAAETYVEQRVEEFRTLAENSPDIIMRIDRSLRHLYVNPAAARLIGVDRAAIVGRTINEVEAYSPVLGFLDIYTRPFQTGEEIEMEVAYPGDPVTWFDLRIIPEPGPGDKVETVLVIASDITQHKTIEEALRRSEERFRIAMVSAGFLVFEMDSGLVYTWCYDARERFTQSPLGKRDSDLFPESEAAELTRLKQSVLDTGQGIHHELRLTTPFGQAYFDLVLEPLRGPGGEVTGLLGASVDISERKLSERELTYRAHLLENVHDAIIATDRDLRITSWNCTAEELYGWKAEEVLGRPIDTIIATGSKDQTHAAVFHNLDAGLSFLREVCQTTRDGRRIWVESQGMALADENGQVTGFVSANRDITGRRALEEENERTRAAIAQQKQLLEQQTALLQRQTELLEAIIANDPGGIAVLTGPDYVFRLVNQAYRDLTPHPEIDPVGRRMDEIWLTKEGFQGPSLIQSVLEDQASITIEHIQREYPNGSKRSFTLHARPITWVDQPAVLLICWERTELDAALEEAHRRASEAEEGRRMLEALMEYIPEGITISSAVDFKVLYVSKYTAGLGPYQRRQLEGRDLQKYAQFWKAYRLDGVTPLQPEELPMVRSVRLGEVIQNEELVLYQAGRKVNLLINAGPIRDAEGHIFASVVTSRDITERKRDEANQRFLGELGRALVVLRSSDEILEGVAYRLGQYLDLDRCFLSEEDVEQDTHVIRYDYHPSMPSIREVLPSGASVPQILERLSQGKTVVIADVNADPITSELDPEPFAPVGVRALIGVPMQDRDGKWTGTLIAASRGPRIWRPDEVALLHSVADLARLALENARLFQSLQDFRRLFEVALRNAPISVYVTDRDLRVSWIFNPHNRWTSDVLEKLPDQPELQGMAEPLISLEKRVLESGRGTHREITLEQAGNIASYEVTVEPLQDVAGQVVGLTVVLMETTEMRRMEAEAVRNLARIEVQRRLIAERELERTRIARELHDGPLQDLIATNFNLVEAMDIIEKEPRLAKMRVIQDMLRSQVQELRRFCNELRPPVLAPFGLEKTIRSHAEGLRDLYPDLNILLNLESDGQRLPEEVRMTLFRVYQELINNVLRHSKASEVSVSFSMEDDQVVLEVKDNGTGFQLPGSWVEMARAGHLGLVGVQERVQISGGQVEVDSTPGEGTRVRVSVPRPAGKEAA